MSEKTKLKPPSEHFEDVVCTGSSIHVVCDLCGRVHFAAQGAGDYDEGEYEALKAAQAKEPDKYIEHDDFVPNGRINCRDAVIGCPCNELSRFESFIWGERYLIMEYYTKRGKQKVNEAAELFRMMRAARKAIAPEPKKPTRKMYLE